MVWTGRNLGIAVVRSSWKSCESTWGSTAATLMWKSNLLKHEYHRMSWMSERTPEVWRLSAMNNETAAAVPQLDTGLGHRGMADFYNSKGGAVTETSGQGYDWVACSEHVMIMSSEIVSRQYRSYSEHSFPFLWWQNGSSWMTSLTKSN